jgi:hypothetical protein
LRVVPKTGLKVWLPAANSGVLVLPRVITPAASRRSTMRWSSVGTLSANIGEPKVVRMPFVTIMSL